MSARMADEFDPIRAAHEELAGLNDILRTMTQRENAAEAAISAAELDLNQIRKLRGYTQMEVQRLRARLMELEAKRS